MIAGEESIRAAFDAAKGQGRAALMPYMMAGFPDRESGLAVAEAYVDAGADLIELGVPFSDPLADGPVIHDADTQALAGGATLRTALEICEVVGGRVPVVLMAYVNMILAHGGGSQFAKLARAAGAAGVIVPDLPLGEAEDIREAFADGGPRDGARRSRRPPRRRGARRSATSPRVSSTSSRPSGPPASGASCRRSSPSWSPRPRPTRGRRRSRSASGSAPRRRPPRSARSPTG